MKHDSARLRTGIATAIVLLLAWSAAARIGWVGTSFFPSPANFWSALQQSVTTGYADGRLWEHLLQSVKLILMGFVSATAIGVPLGLWMGWSRRAEALRLVGMTSPLAERGPLIGAIRLALDELEPRLLAGLEEAA